MHSSSHIYHTRIAKFQVTRARTLAMVAMARVCSTTTPAASARTLPWVARLRHVHAKKCVRACASSQQQPAAAASQQQQQQPSTTGSALPEVAGDIHLHVQTLHVESLHVHLTTEPGAAGAAAAAGLGAAAPSEQDIQVRLSHTAWLLHHAWPAGPCMRMLFLEKHWHKPLRALSGVNAA